MATNTKQEKNRIFYDAEDIQEMLGVSRGKSYALIHDLNTELGEQGFIVIPGKIPKKFFAQKYYGMSV